MVWTDSIKVIATGIAYEETAGTAETAPQEYTYINNDGVLNCPRDFDEFTAHSSRAVTFSVPKAYHTTGSFASWVFPETNGFGYWLSGALGTDGTPTKHGTLTYIHQIDVANSQIPSYTLWMKTGVYEYKSTNNQIASLTIDQAKNSVLSATVNTIGSGLTTTTDFGTASYVTDANDCFTSQKAYVLWDDTWITNVSNLSITIDNGIDPEEPKVMGKEYADHILAGARKVTGNATVFVEDTTQIEDYWGSATGPTASTTTVPLRVIWLSDTIETVTTQTTAMQELQVSGSTTTITPGGSYTGTDAALFEVKITTDGTPDKFMWRKNWGAWSTETQTSTEAVSLSDGVTVTFSSESGAKVGDRWFWRTGRRPYCLDIHMPSCRINTFDQQSTGNRLSANVTFTGMISRDYNYDIRAYLHNTKSATYNVHT